MGQKTKHCLFCDQPAAPERPLCHHHHHLARIDYERRRREAARRRRGGGSPPVLTRCPRGCGDPLLPRELADHQCPVLHAVDFLHQAEPILGVSR